jgi:hypothetical protein
MIFEFHITSINRNLVLFKTKYFSQGTRKFV